MDVGRDGRMVGEDGEGARPSAILVGAGRRVVAEGERERLEVSLGRALGRRNARTRGGPGRVESHFYSVKAVEGDLGAMSFSSISF